MHASLVVLALGAISAVSGSPVEVRATKALPNGDIDILNYALTLEYLERKFYQQGLKNYTRSDFRKAGYSNDFYNNLQNIYSDERTHVSFLATALGNKAIPEPTFAFPSTNVASFLSLSAVLEGVGVSAYLGAAASIVDKGYLTAAGSILTVEARHASYVRNAIKQEPFPAPFDTPLDFNQVYSLAAQFIKSFAPGTPKLPFKAFPALKVSRSRSGGVVFNGAAASKSYGSGQVYAVFYSGLDTFYSKAAVSGKDYTIKSVPVGMMGKSNPRGQVYVVLSTADGKSKKVSDDNIIAGVGILEL